MRARNGKFSSNRRGIVRIAVFASGSMLAAILLAGGYAWYSVQKTMDAMYEPLPSKDWIEPLFEAEALSEQPAEPGPAEGLTVGTGTMEEREGYRFTAETANSSEPAVIGAKDAERLRRPSIANKEPFAILLLGVDERPGDRGRSDTMILLTVQPRSGKAVAVSIPRDTRTRMPNSGKYDKINHAYAFGGASLSVEAVEQLFGVPIAYYMKTNMEGLVNIVDTVGGVDVDNPKAFEYEGYSFPAGRQHLNGEEALAYSRMRKQDPQGDFGRTQRQRQILASSVDRLSSAGSIVKLPKLLSHLSAYVRTNLTSGNMADLVTRYRPAIADVEILGVQGSGKIIDGIYYYIVAPEERRRIQSEILNCLNSG
ncbi:LCP family protein [Paenibacillaceae bacterium WGS1546]|uniref:LCP family glycopolymer transferase n=1 Tax=Cohnella sp. WGS1546 TaxID=3366810 RepID=UPI00372CEEF8